MKCTGGEVVWILSGSYGWCLSTIVAFFEVKSVFKFELRRLLDNPFEPLGRQKNSQYKEGVGIDF